MSKYSDLEERIKVLEKAAEDAKWVKPYPNHDWPDWLWRVSTTTTAKGTLWNAGDVIG